MKYQAISKKIKGPMKNQLLLFRLLLIPLLFLATTACRDDDDGPQPENRHEILTAYPWKIKRVLGNGINITNFPEVSQFHNAQIKFNDDGTYTMTNDTETTTGTWAFAEDETKIILNAGTPEELVLDIVSLREDAGKFRTNRELAPFGTVELTLEVIPVLPAIPFS
jgi:Lipocalin-like domain